MLLPGERLNAIRSNNIAKRQDIPLKQKRLELIIAFQKLGIDKYSYCDFMRDHIKIEKQFLKENRSLISQEALFTRRKNIIQLEFIVQVLECF
jgi:hypothetical protein